MLSIELVAEFPGTSFSAASWVTVTAWCVSLLVSPLIVQLCRTYSIRLIAVIGKPSVLCLVLGLMFSSGLRWAQYESLFLICLIWPRSPSSIH